MKTSINGFVVLETFKQDWTRIRVWMFHSDVEAAEFCIEMIKKYGDKFDYLVKRANVIEME